jgi:hypothetical protein
MIVSGSSIRRAGFWQPTALKRDPTTLTFSIEATERVRGFLQDNPAERHRSSVTSWLESALE